MAREIERKFLVKGELWRNGADATEIRQGYLSIDPERTVRVRIAGEKAFLTIKGASVGIERAEYEYAIALKEAESLMALCLPTIICKTRYSLDHLGWRWEIDQFHGSNEGLVVAEIELQSQDELFHKPIWLGREVSKEGQYYNVALAKHPFSQWHNKK